MIKHGTNFEYLLQLIGPRTKKQDTVFRESIPAKVRLAVTLFSNWRFIQKSSLLIQDFPRSYITDRARNASK
ncbi:unnamed protein product [Acanthoscelides obtectus]|uniref:Uncharacterized protein n=1 Tax=Acanthoscelides obtectus TaxID=200917 RepID=A0A9P0MHP0_ACAOB|nr:unnamed protein product [Acanthoscelides obtectus]CAK1680397.1 hypothetical protein AOBTE_LOCUS32619 [Acanthoscelides obtectus]